MPEEQSKPNLDNIRVVMDLARLGELIAAVATTFASLRDIEPPDYDGEEMRTLAVAGWRYVEHMFDRVKFEASVQADFAKLDEITTALAPTHEEPTHKPEFGFFDPPA